MKGKNRLRKIGPVKEETIVQTTYMVTIVAAKGTPERNLWIGRHFTPTINRAIDAAIQKAAAKALLTMSGAESSTNRSVSKTEWANGESKSA